MNEYEKEKLITTFCKIFGVFFILFGITKLLGFSIFFQYLENLGFKPFIIYLIAIFEVLGGILLFNKKIRKFAVLILAAVSFSQFLSYLVFVRSGTDFIFPLILFIFMSTLYWQLEELIL